ncbi:MAG: hypothetical protein HQM08_04300 [Candidatus Riflebacteria bacterium]|nr:hypothetical protein [Candidatus Riflebacteria bacterium]
MPYLLDTKQLQLSNSLLQDSIVRRLIAQTSKGRIAQTYLFTGAFSSGKKTVATAFAASMLCKTPRNERENINACGTCESCRAVLFDSHPDLTFLYPIGSEIRVGQIREMQKSAALKPMLGDWRFFVICKADSLNEFSGNSLLKILEESPPHLIFILVAENERKVLPTILSRAELLAFRDPSYREIREFLCHRCSKDYSTASRFLSLSGGRQGQAVTWLLKNIPHQELPRLSLPDSQISYLNELEKISSRLLKKIEAQKSLEGLLRVFDDVSLVETHELSNARREFCLRLFGAPLLPASFPILFSGIFLDTLERLKNELKKNTEKIIKLQKENYPSALLKELEEGCGHSISEIVFTQIDAFLNYLCLIAKDMLYAGHSPEQELLLNIDEKEIIISALKFHGLPRVEAKIRLIGQARDLLGRYVNPGLILENILSDFGGRFL